MNNVGKLLFLGTGGSLGIPVIGCDCAMCQSTDPHNKRLRSSVLITVDNKRVLIDCGPDFRYQALKHHIKTLDGIILTHAHYDHASGLDELRIYAIRKQSPLPLLLSTETFEEIKKGHDYLFKENVVDQLKTKFEVQLLEKTQGQTEFLGIKTRYISYEQAGMRVNGFRFGNIAYVSDIRTYDDSIYEELQGLDTLIISALRYIPSALHFTIDEAAAFIKRCGAKKGWLVHVTHEVDHQQANAYLPENVRMAYDGLEISFTPE